MHNVSLMYNKQKITSSSHGEFWVCSTWKYLELKFSLLNYSTKCMLKCLKCYIHNLKSIYTNIDNLIASEPTCNRLI